MLAQLICLWLSVVTSAATPDLFVSRYTQVAPDSSTARRLYGIRTFSNPSSSTSIAVDADSSSVVFRASKIASEGNTGYSARVGFDHSILPSGESVDISGYEALTFQYRNPFEITDYFAIQFLSTDYPDSLASQGLIFQLALNSSSQRAAKSSFKAAELYFADLATPAWWTDIPADFPQIEQILKTVRAIRFEPKTTYAGNGIVNGQECWKCVGPTMTQQVVEIRDIAFTHLQKPIDPPPVVTPYTPRHRMDCDPTPYQLKTPGGMYIQKPSDGFWNKPLSSYIFAAPDTALTKTIYGICGDANASSRFDLSVAKDSFVRMDVTLRSDGDMAYSALAYMVHHITPGIETWDLEGLQTVTFEYRNSKPITDRLIVQLVSDVYREELMDKATVYQAEIRGAANLAPGTEWKKIALPIRSFTTPLWWTDIPEDFPQLDSVLKNVKAIRILPVSAYAESGLHGTTSCLHCAGPTTPPFVLDIRNIRFHRNDVSYPPNPEPVTSRNRLDCDPRPFTLAGEGLEEVESYPDSNWNNPLSTYPKGAPDSSSALSEYGVCAEANPASKIALSVVPDSFIRFESKLSSEGTLGHSARTYLVHSLAPGGGPRDMSRLDSVAFEFRNDRTITDILSVQLVSSAYADIPADSGIVHEYAVRGDLLAGGSTWKRVVFRPSAMARPGWSTPMSVDLPPLANVLSSLKGLRFQPRSTYSDSGSDGWTGCARCTNPTMPELRLDLRQIVLYGSVEPTIPGDTGTSDPPPPIVVEPPPCSGSSVVLDTTFNDMTNAFGLPWWRVSDFDSTGISQDPWKGSSGSHHSVGRDSNTWIGLDAILDRRTNGTVHPYAGWSGIGTRLPSSHEWDKTYGHLVNPMRGAIGFRLIPTAKLPTAVRGFRVRAYRSGETDSTARSVLIRRDQFDSGAGHFCVQYKDFRTPLGVDSGLAGFSPDFLTSLRWVVELDTGTGTDNARVGFRLGDVRLFGIRGFTLATNPTQATSGLHAGFSNGFLVMEGFDGYERFEIRSLDGRTVATFAPSRFIRLDLAPGTWLLTARRGTSRTILRLAVTGK